MATKTTPEKKNTPKLVDSTTNQNGSQTPDEHLEKANRAMTKAWDAISRRQNKGD